MVSWEWGKETVCASYEVPVSGGEEEEWVPPVWPHRSRWGEDCLEEAGPWAWEEARGVVLTFADCSAGCCVWS